MYRGRTLSLSFPPFEGWVRRIVLTCAGVFFLQVAFDVIARPVVDFMNVYLGLVPANVVHFGMIWQLVTYSFLHAGVMHLLVNMLTLWMFGAQEEQDWGS